MDRGRNAAVYTIRVAGRIDPRWASWFDGCTVTPADGETVIVGEVADQPALHGLLARIRDLNLVLLSVERDRAA